MEIKDTYIEYPKYDDSEFNIKISTKEEFRLSGKQRKVTDASDVEKLANDICHSKFSLRPHQLFVRNFLSFQTPYNTLVLFHGVGTGKTCSAISIAEEMRGYMKQTGSIKQTIIVASPNVQNNFRKQLFDESKLQQNGNVFSMPSCIGGEIINEVNPNNTISSKEELIKKIEKIIDVSYVFMGYIKFSKWISLLKPNEIKQIFEDRLVIIDEAHNIRSIEKDSKKKTTGSQGIDKLVSHNYNTRLLLLSATPMFNSYKEIIWLIDIINRNEGKMRVVHKDIFDKNGNFLISESGEEIGKKHFIRTIRGYISFVRGEDPFTFPYKIYPSQFSIPEKSILMTKSHNPTKQYNDIIIPEGIEHIDLYLTKIYDYQQSVYNYCIEMVNHEHGNRNNNADNNMYVNRTGYLKLMQPLQALNIVFPYSDIDLTNTATYPPPDNLVGKKGFSRIVKNINAVPLEFNDEYLENNRSIFSKDNIDKYSSKINSIIEQVENSSGICLIYSQYIYSGLIPIACALEERGYNNNSKKINIISDEYKRKNKIKSNKLKYVIISGQKDISQTIEEDINTAISKENKDGELIKVILISRTGSEGIDFKNIRNVHILEPWHNMNRNEQIIGRAIRDCSHKDLAFQERNVEIYLYGTNLESDYEAVDVFLYRNCERKSRQIGIITRLMKEHSVDCLLQHTNTNLSPSELNIDVLIKTSSGKNIQYELGDKPYSSICDYMESCQYKCNILDDKTSIVKEIDAITRKSDSSTLHENHMVLNINILKQKIKDLYGASGTKLVYSENEVEQLINFNNQYSQIQVDLALYQLSNKKTTDIIVDKYGNKGRIVYINDLYIFQPSYSQNKSITMEERSADIDKKRESIELVVDDIFDTNVTFKLDTELAINTMKKLKEQVEGKGDGRSDGKIMDTAEPGLYTDTIAPKLNELFSNYSEYETSILYEFYIEKLQFNELCNLFIYMITTVSAKDDIKNEYNYVNEYVMKHNVDVESLNINCFIIQNKDLSDYIIMVHDNTNSEENLWNYADELTITLIREFVDKKLITLRSNTNSIFGFNYIKSAKDKRSKSRGIKLKLDKTSKNLSIVAQSISKEELISMFVKIDDKLNNDDFLITFLTNDIKVTRRIVIVMEIILRYKDKTSDNRFFLTIQEALYNSGSKYLNLV